MNNAIEKRRFDRFEFRETIRVSPVVPSKSGNIYEVQPSSFEAKASDISEGGLRLDADESLNPNHLVKLNFEMAKDKSVEVYAKIVWSEKRNYGMSFMVVDEYMHRGIKALSKNK